jgi:hypothetical protein
MMNGSKLFVTWSCAATLIATPAIAPAQERGSVINEVVLQDTVTVDATRTEALRVTTLLAPAAPKQSQVVSIIAEPMRDRFSISAEWGPDNAFSGKMIEQASGQTVRGVPINLNETSYDDTYGRLSLFKIGLGYRTTLNSEVVFNFVLSRSGAETVNIGTVGAAGVPLTVNFSDMDYWGFEGGQRMFFTGARIRPFVGYLVGANRYGDTTGTFVDVPLELTPGLAAQDGTFFEKSWAFSVGPTGGLVIGFGPVEVLTELQFRFMGGLSDVDWLVEEGLRDINSESSRWSLPLTFGARFRF